MDFIGLNLGDISNTEQLTLKVKNFQIKYPIVDQMYRAIDGSLNRQLIRGITPKVSMNLDMLNDQMVGILTGARTQRQVMRLSFIRNNPVIRQMEITNGSSFYLTKSSFYNLSVSKVYKLADFNGDVNYFTAYDSLTGLVTHSGSFTNGEKVYVDYEWSQILVFLTDLSANPYPGAYRQYSTAQVTFEGV
jgi:hypothetical protein